MSLVAGIDAGTQSVKVVLYDPASRQLVDAASAPLDLIQGEDGSREQHPSDWVHAMGACFDRFEPGLRSRVRALAVSGQQHGFVPLDAAGRVLAPAKLWCDTSTAAECDEIMEAVGGAEACIAAAGNPILAGYTASKLPWTRRHRPDVYARLASILLPHDYLNFVLTGQRWCEYGDASGTGWLDVRRRQWSRTMLRATDPDRDLSTCLPPLVGADALFRIDASMAATLGLPVDAVVAAGGGDNMMAAIGTGCVAEGRLAMSLGTSGTLFAYADAPVVSERGEWAAFCSSSGGWLPLICTMNCTVATEQVARLFGFGTSEGDAYVDATEPGADGLCMLPFFNGERTPDLPRAKGLLAGLDPSNMSPAHLYRAAMEGATHSLRYGFDAFVRAGLQFDRIVLTGGGANSAAWRRMVADVFDLPVDVPRQAEGAAFGAALQALWAVRRAAGEAVSIAGIVAEHVAMDAARGVTPDPRRVAAHDLPYRRFLQHLDAAAPLHQA